MVLSTAKHTRGTPKVEYSRTELGKSLLPVLNALIEWGKSYASYLIARQNSHCAYKAGKVYENIDDLVKSEQRRIWNTLEQWSGGYAKY